MFQATPVADLIDTVIQLYIYVLIAAAVLSWLTWPSGSSIVTIPSSTASAGSAMP